jgi:hypothetical protein
MPPVTRSSKSELWTSQARWTAGTRALPQSFAVLRLLRHAHDFPAPPRPDSSNRCDGPQLRLAPRVKCRSGSRGPRARGLLRGSRTRLRRVARRLGLCALRHAAL